MKMEIEEIAIIPPLPLICLNHVSLLSRCVRTSVRFYQEVLGFVVIKRPSSFNFHGAWLFNYGIGVHLLENGSIEDCDVLRESRPINPKDNHMSFQCTDIGLVKRRLEEMGIKYVKATVEEGGIRVDQVFFHDPDGYMIEICNCENLPVLPLSSPPSSSTFDQLKANCGCNRAAGIGCGMMETMMMESLSMDMINISF